MKASVIFSILLLCLSNSAFGQVQYIRKLQKNLSSIKDSIQYVDAANKIAMLFYEQDIDSTLHYSVHARTIAQRLRYQKGVADATNNLGIVYDLKGNMQLALRYYNDAYNQYVSIGDSSNLVQTLMNIATVYGISGKDQKAVSHFKQALSLGNKISHDSITALVIYNFILMYPDSLAENTKTMYFRKASGISRKYHDTRTQLALQQLTADNYIAGDEREKGIELLKQTLSQTLQMELYYLSMDLLIELGDQNLGTNPETAVGYYKHAMAISEQKNYRIYAIDLAKRLSSLYSAKNDTSKVYFYDQKLLTLYQEQIEIDKSSGIDYIEFAVKDQLLMSAQIKSDYNSKMLWLAVAICVLTILSIAFLWRNWMLSRKTNEVLKIQFGQLESTSQALESTNENYAQIIKIVAHDLRNPIGGILSLSSILMEENPAPEDSREFLQLIHNSSNSCLTLIGDLLRTDFNVKESELKKEVIDLSLLLHQAVKLLVFRAKEKNQELTLKDEGKTVIFADRDKFLRVLNNLVINAIKFTPNGGSIQINTQKSRDGVLITVRDNGFGIPKEFTQKIFDPFTTAKRTGTAGEQPFGLGLYISKQIVEAHNGRIWFESEPGEGTLFSVFFPVDGR